MFEYNVLFDDFDSIFLWKNGEMMKPVGEVGNHALSYFNIYTPFGH